ncbi:MAG TPA: dNTP triphosphohydrolase [Thermoanaerobaculia bacterium]|nr:dNTP triphosphohydrolase [Thermoanaerobaculia bacterium]
MNRLYRPDDYARFSGLGGDQPDWRSPFRRDYARLLHSAACRRLQGKTQLFAGEESDFFRNRLTHSLEVAQIACTIASKLNHETLAEHDMALDSHLVAFAALAHDLGHPPFGHTGESELDELLRGHGGFEGNAQTLRLLARTEKKLIDFDRQWANASPDQPDGHGAPRWFEAGQDVGMGLDPCARSLASVLKYDDEIPVEREQNPQLVKGYYGTERPIVDAIREKVGSPPEGCSQTIECQIMDLADDIAYSTYDIEDAFHANLLTPLDLLAAPPLVLAQVAERCSGELRRELTPEEVLGILERDVFPRFSEPPQGEPLEHLRHLHRVSKLTAANAFFRGELTSGLVDRAVRAVEVEVNDENPAYSLVRMEPGARAVVSVMKHLVYVSLIQSPRMKLVAVRGRIVVRTIFQQLMDSDGCELLPSDWLDRFHQAPADLQPRVVADFIAGMTDRQALDFYSRLTSSSFRSMFGLH